MEELGLNYPEKKFGGAWARFGGPVPPGPNVEPPLTTRSLSVIRRSWWSDRWPTTTLRLRPQRQFVESTSRKATGNLFRQTAGVPCGRTLTDDTIGQNSPANVCYHQQPHHVLSSLGAARRHKSNQLRPFDMIKTGGHPLSKATACSAHLWKCVSKKL